MQFYKPMRTVLPAVMVIGFVLGAITSPMLAQENEQFLCSYIYPNGDASVAGELSFDDCVAVVFDGLNRDELVQAFGVWGDIYINIEDNGDVFYGTPGEKAGTVESWAYWGNFAQSAEFATQDVLALASQDLNSFWLGIFEANNIPYQSPVVHVYSDTRISTECGRLTLNDGPLFCANDYTIYLPEDFTQKYEEVVGDSASILILSHEWGHAIQFQLNLLNNQSLKSELQADCLAGAYAQYATEQGTAEFLHMENAEEQASALFLATDASSWLDTSLNGTHMERMDAFKNGFTYGVEACFD